MAPHPNPPSQSASRNPQSAIVLIAILLLTGCASAQTKSRDTYANPLDVLCADPFIYHEKDTYYLYATAAWDGLLVWTSNDLVNWRLRGHAFKRTDKTWSHDLFWAPELFTHHGKYYLHYTVVGGNDQRRIVLAESDSPLGPFHELRAPWFDAHRETIDSHVFRDTDGKLYLYTVYFGIKLLPFFEIHVRRVDDNLNPEPQSTMCVIADQKWEGFVNEGPFVVRRGDTYLLTYSAVGYKSPDYCIGIASAKSPLGPWTKEPKPILHKIAGVSGPGHHCFIDSPDHSEWFIAYHTHQHLAHPGGPRQLAIERIHFIPPSPDSPSPTIKVDGPTITPQLMPSGSSPLVRGQNEEFNDAPGGLDRRRWTIFSEDPRFWSLSNGSLTIRTKDGDVYEERSDLSNLFLQYAPPPPADFDVITKCEIHPEKDFEQAFLMIWQDHEHYAKLGILHSHGNTKLEVADEQDSHYHSTLHDLPSDAQTSIPKYLRINKRADTYEFLTSPDNKKWTPLEHRPLNLIDLRIGIGACSPTSTRSIPATFDFVHFQSPEK